MGMFSFDCVECGHPVLSHMAADEGNGWMTRAVVHVEGDDDPVALGDYDGYGRVGDSDRGEIGDTGCWRHEACWVAMGRPGYTRDSESAADQGWFYDDEVHAHPRPATPEDVASIRAEPEDRVSSVEHVFGKELG